MHKPLISATTTGVTAAAIAAVIALTGCSSDSGTGSTESTNHGGAAAPSSGPAGGSAPVSGAPGAADTAKRIEGTWAGLTSGRTVALSVKNGKAALLADKHVCQGSVEFMGEPMLAMTCADGSTDRVMGAIVGLLRGEFLFCNFFGDDVAGSGGTFAITGPWHKGAL